MKARKQSSRGRATHGRDTSSADRAFDPIEGIESRRLLTAAVVNTAAEQIDSPSGGIVSLRDAFATAEQDQTGSASARRT